MKSLLDLAAEAKITVPPPADEEKPVLDVDREICASIGLEVLGETEDRNIRVFSTRLHKDTTIKSIRFFSYEDLLQAAGKIVKTKVHEAVDIPPGSHHFKQVKRAIAVLGGETRILDDVWRGVGCWPGDSGETVLVGAGQAAVWDGQKLHRIEKPRAAGLFLDLSSGKQWYEFEQLERYLADMTPDWIRKTVEEVVDLFDRWKWQEAGNLEMAVCPFLVTGLILATWIQTAWTWRPMVAIRGESNSGKSVFFETMSAMFGRLSLLNAKSSEAGLRQAIGHTAVVILLDEFEKSKQREQILELLRTSGRGAITLRGTSNQTGLSSGLHHIAWLAAIEVGMERAPDWNRYLFFELIVPPLEQRGKLNIPPDEHLADLGQKMLAVAVFFQREAMALHKTLKLHILPGVHNRVVESLAVPVSMLALCGENEPTKLLETLQGALGSDPEVNATDQETLMKAILGSNILLEKGTQITVGQVLAHQEKHDVEALERFGIAVVNTRRGPRTATGDRALFIDPVAVKRYLLKETHWADQAIQQILIRLTGTSTTQRTIASKKVWGIQVSWGVLVDDFLQEEEEDSF